MSAILLWGRKIQHNDLFFLTKSLVFTNKNPDFFIIKSLDVALGSVSCLLLSPLFFVTIDPAAGPSYKQSSNDCNTFTICARDKIQTVSERGENELCEDIWCITVAQSTHEALLSKHSKKKSALPRFYYVFQVTVTPQPISARKNIKMVPER